MLKELGERFRGLFPAPGINEEEFEMYKRARGLYIEDPWERVKIIFKLDNYNSVHPELRRAMHYAQLGFIIGGGFAGIMTSYRTSKSFVRTNDWNVYMSKNEMYRKMTDRCLLEMGKSTIRYGTKIGLFLGCFSLISSCCEAYRNKSGVIEYVIGGYIVGGVTKSAFGIKGFTAGGIVGAILGFIFGSIGVGFEKLTKTDKLTLKYAQYAYALHRDKISKELKYSKTSASDQLIISLHGEHEENPLNKFTEENSKKI